MKNPACWTCNDTGLFMSLKFNLLPCTRCGKPHDLARKGIPPYNEQEERESFSLNMETMELTKLEPVNDRYWEGK